MSKVSSTPIYQKYELQTDLGYVVYAKISAGEITLKTHRNQPNFLFKKSDPEIIEAVASMMLEAVKLSKKENK